MQTFLLTWNPERFTWDDLPIIAEEWVAAGSVTMRWTCGNTKRIVPGDTVFLLRQGGNSPGIVGSGYALTAPYSHQHWNGERGRTARYVSVRFLSILNAPAQPPLNVRDPKGAALKGVHWSTQSSGISIPADRAITLTHLWTHHLRTLGLSEGRWYSTDDYDDALGRVWTTLTHKQQQMLRAHAAAPDGLLSWKELASAGGYTSFKAVNSQYGMVGRKIAKALGGDRTAVRVATRFLADDYREPGRELMWTMEPALVTALAQRSIGGRFVGSATTAAQGSEGHSDRMNSGAYVAMLRDLGFADVQRSRLLRHRDADVPSCYLNWTREELVYFTGYKKDQGRYDSWLWKTIEPQQKKDREGRLMTVVPRTGYEREALRSLITGTVDPDTRDDIEEETINERADIGPTVRDQLIKARRGKDVYRRKLELIEGTCRITGVADGAHLRASHIKPWYQCTDQEKLDGFNGLLLSPHVDHLFDRGYITFGDDGSVMLAKGLNPDVLVRWGIQLPQNVGGFRPEQRRYLAYHRSNVFDKPKALPVQADR
jgi:hypothetical protein